MCSAFNEENLHQVFELRNEAFTKVPWITPGRKTLICSLEAFCTGFRESSRWDPREPVKGGEILKYSSVHSCIGSIHIYRTAKFEGGWGSFTRDIGETVKRLFGSWEPYHHWKSDDGKTPHHRNITLLGIIWSRCNRFRFLFSVKFPSSWRLPRLEAYGDG